MKVVFWRAHGGVVVARAKRTDFWHSTVFPTLA